MRRAPHSDKVRLGIVGCGPIAQYAHLPSCQKAELIDLYAICDHSSDLLQRMAAIYEPQHAYGNYDDLLADQNVDGVIVATADAFHIPLATAALAAGKHVFVEKPLGLNIDEAEQLAVAAAESGLVLQVGNMKRFDPGIMSAQQFVQNDMGQMLALKAWYCDSVYRYTMTDNLLPPVVTGDKRLVPEDNPKADDRRRYYLLTHGSHLVDTARFFGGEIASLRAQFVDKFGAHCWFVALRFADGSVGHLDLTIAVRMDWHEGFQIYGEKGSVLGKTYLPWYLKSSEVECFSCETQSYQRVLGQDGHVYRRQLEAFARGILDGKQVTPDARDGVEALKILAAIAESVRTGQDAEPKTMKGVV